MLWTHSRIMSTADAGTAVVVDDGNGWDAYPFGLENGSCGVFPNRERAIEAVEAVAGDMICCVGHLADDAEDQPARAATG